MSSPTLPRVDFNRRTPRQTRTELIGGMTFRPDIEGLRAIAVLLVVLGHAGVPFVRGGYVGVDVFFVISGFLITSLLLGELSRSGSISIRRFYARRAVRLLPVATLVVGATVIAGWLWLPATRLRSILVDAASSSVYAINYRLAVQGTDYLAAEGPPSPLQHFWSLAVEEQFYLVWPVLLIVLAVLWRKRGKVPIWPIAGTLALVIAASLYLSVTQTASAAPWAYFGSHTRAWELAVGALVALFATQAARLPKAIAAAMGWMGVAAILTSAALFNETSPFPGYLALLPVLGTAFVICAGCRSQDGDVQGLLGIRPMQLIGKLSYGWYLWHWPLLLIGPAALGVEPSLSVNLSLIAAAFILSGISYELVENPIRNRRNLRSIPWRGISLGVALSGSVAIAAAVAFVAVPPAVGTGDAVDLTNRTLTEDELKDFLISASDMTEAPANLTPSLDAASGDLPPIYADGCHLDYEELAPEAPCLYGNPDGDRTMVLFGDSHAAHWFPALNVFATQNDWRLLSFTKSACPAPSIVTFISELNRDYDECVTWRAETLASIDRMEPDLLVMSTSDGNSPKEKQNQEQIWTDGLVESFNAINNDKTRLAFIADTPSFPEKVPDCIAQNLTEVSQCNGSPQESVRKPERRSMVIEALEANGVTVIDPLPLFCTTDVCPVVTGNVLMFRDGHHVSTAYAELISPFLIARLPLD